MEAAAVGFVAEAVNIPSIVVKSVTDYADSDKDDSFRDFGCVISAAFLIAFLKEHPPASLRSATNYLSSTQWGVQEVHEHAEAFEKHHEETREYLKFILSILEDASISTGDISLGHARTKKGDQRLAINVPIALKKSEWDKKLQAAIGSEAQIRYVLGVHIGNPGEAAKKKGFADASTRPVHLGLGIGGVKGVRGTLGPFIQLSNGEPGFLTAAHVFQQGQVEIQSPVVTQGGSGDVIGFIFDLNTELEVCQSRLRYAVNFLGNVVPVGYDFPYEGETIRPMALEQLIQLPAATPVFKIGATSGVTSGNLTAFSMDDVVIHGPSGPVRFDDLIEIQSQPNTPFSMPGDSGAAVYTRITDQLYCLGIHFASGTLNIDGKKAHFSYCIPIWNLLTRLDHVRWIDWAVM